jgi:tRNA A37 threonylcarbamoyladenosine modification protein TsaB
MANGRRMVGVSTLDALEKAFREPFAGDPVKKVPGTFFLGAWLDAQRGEVFSALYRGGALVDGPDAEKPAVALARWSSLVGSGDVVFVGDGASAYGSVITTAFPNASILAEVFPLAPAVGQLAAEAAERNEAVEPDAVRPIYVRRPDVELARDRRAAQSSTP